jgi:hypothetical protein
LQLSEVHIDITRLLALGDALTVRGARPIGGLVRAAAGGAAKWCMRAFAASRTTRDLARMLSRKVGFRADGARRRLGGAPCRGMAVQAAANAACGGSEGEVAPQTDLAVEEVEQGGAVDDVLHRELPDKRDHDGRCLLPNSLGFGGEPARVATHAKLGIKHGELVS